MLTAAAFGVLTLHTAVAERQCASPADQAVFEVQALRSELMVLATGCRDDDNYNAFMRRYQADLLANDHAVGAYFKRKFPRTAQQEHDRFVTDLANALSQEGSKLGSEFCPHNGLIFAEVLALRSAADLPHYAAGKDLIPASMGICQEPAPAAPTKAAKPNMRTANK